VKSILIVKKSIRFLALAAIAGTAFSAQAKDIAAGKAKAEAACAACHGKDGISTIDPSYPKLAGSLPANTLTISCWRLVNTKAVQEKMRLWDRKRLRLVKQTWKTSPRITRV